MKENLISVEALAILWARDHECLIHLLEGGLISKKEYSEIRDRLIKKYHKDEE